MKYTWMKPLGYSDVCTNELLKLVWRIFVVAPINLFCQYRMGGLHIRGVSGVMGWEAAAMRDTFNELVNRLLYLLSILWK